MSVSVLSPDERPSLFPLEVPAAAAAAAFVVVGSEEVAGDSVSSLDEFGVALSQWRRFVTFMVWTLSSDFSCTFYLLCWYLELHILNTTMCIFSGTNGLQPKPS